MLSRFHFVLLLWLLAETVNGNSQSCSSLDVIKSQLESSSNSSCSIPADCLSISCQTFVPHFNVSLSFSVSLQPCDTPDPSVRVQVEGFGLLLDGVYAQSGSHHVNSLSAEIVVDVQQQSFGVTFGLGFNLSSAGSDGGSTVTYLIDNADISMSCQSRVTPSPTPTPTATPIATPTPMGVTSIQLYHSRPVEYNITSSDTLYIDCLPDLYSAYSEDTQFTDVAFGNWTLDGTVLDAKSYAGLEIADSGGQLRVFGDRSPPAGDYQCSLCFTLALLVENTCLNGIVSLHILPAVTTPTPSPTSEPPICAPRVTLSQMCDSLSNLKTQTLSTEGTTGECTISDDCRNLQCVLVVNFFNTDVPISFNMTLLPCASPYSFELQVISATLGGEVVNGIYSETTEVPFIVFGFNGVVSITVVQQTNAATVSVTATVIGQTLIVIPDADVYMHCVGVCAVSNTTVLASSTLPSPSPSSSSPTLEPPTCAPRVALSQMCDSLSSLKTQTLSTEGTSGECTISDDCLNLDCAFTITYLGINVPLNQSMTLLPCTSPYSFRLIVSSTFLGGELVNGVYSESDSVPFTALGVSGNVVITVVQQEFGVTVSVAAEVPLLSLSLTVISQTDVYMHCAGRCPSVPTLQTTAVQPPSPSSSSSLLSSTPSPSLSPSIFPLSASPSPSPSSSLLPSTHSPASPSPSALPSTASSQLPTSSPTSEPPTCTPRVTLSQMCDSLSSLKTQTLSTEGTTGDCTISDDCLNLDCAFTITYLGINVPLNQSMTLLPCTSPYSFRLIVSSTFLGGELVNGVYSESDSVPFTALGVSGNVVITVVQQEFGVTVSVAAEVPLLSLSLTVISQTDVYMHCAGRCPSVPTLQTTAVQPPSPSSSSSLLSSTPSPSLSPSIFPLSASPSPSPSSSLLPSTHSPASPSPSALPSTASSQLPTSSPTSEPPTCTPRVTLSQMCDSLSSLKTQTLSTEGTTGDCTISDDCLNLDCAFTITYLGINVPLNQSMTLLPFTSPYSFRLIVSSTFLGGELVNGDYSESDSVPFTALGVSGNVVITVVQQEFGVTVSVAAEVPLLSLSLTVISQTDVYMHCAGQCPSVPTLPTTAVQPPSPSSSSSLLSSTPSSSLSPSPFPSSSMLPSTPSPSAPPSTATSRPPTPSPTSEPPTCAPRVTLSQMCDSLSNLKTQTLALEGTTGDCTISDDCLNLDCAFTVAYSTLTVPLNQNMTLLPCTSPYSFRLIVSSTFLGGELVNGVYSESDSVPFTALGVSGDVVITVVQQEFGVTISVAADIPSLSLSLTVISQTDIYMHCADICAVVSPTVPTATGLPSSSTTPSPSPSSPSPSSRSTSTPSPSPMLTPTSTSMPALLPATSLRTYIYVANGLVFATAGVTAILVVALWFSECNKGVVHQLGKLRHVIHISFAVSLVGAVLSFVLGHEFARDAENLTTCRVVSGLLFYFALSSAFWLVCDVGALAYMVTKAVLRMPLVSYILIFIVGWGLPVLPVVITALVNTEQLVTWNGNGTAINFCWIDANQLAAYGFIAPLVACTLVGFVYMGLVFRGLVCVQTGHVQFNGESSDSEEPVKANIVFNVVCQLFLSIAIVGMWLFGLFFMNQYENETRRTVFAVFFIVFAVLQCVLFVLLGVVGHPKVWHFLCCCCGNPTDVRHSERNAQLWESAAQMNGREATVNNYAALERQSHVNSKDAHIELTQTGSKTFTGNCNGVTDGDDTSIKDVEVEIRKEGGNPIFSDEATPPPCPPATIGGSSQGSLNFATSTATGNSNGPDSSLPTLPTSLLPPSQQEDTTQV